MSRPKGDIRRDLLQLRDSLPAEIRKQKDERIRETLTCLPEFRSAQTVLLYASFRTEADTFGIMHTCLSEGKTLLLPRVVREDCSLRLYEIRDLSEVEPGYMGIPEPLPSDERLRDIGIADLVIVPGVGFDRSCNRLGYGKGFYDRLLTGREGKAVIGLAYAEQLLEALPSEPHDVRMDTIITDEEIINCHGH